MCLFNLSPYPQQSFWMVNNQLNANVLMVESQRFHQHLAGAAGAAAAQRSSIKLSFVEHVNNIMLSCFTSRARKDTFELLMRIKGCCKEKTALVLVSDSD